MPYCEYFLGGKAARQSCMLYRLRSATICTPIAGRVRVSRCLKLPYLLHEYLYTFVPPLARRIVRGTNEKKLEG